MTAAARVAVGTAADGDGGGKGVAEGRGGEDDGGPEGVEEGGGGRRRDGGCGVYHPYRVGHLIMGGQRVCWGWVRVGVGMWVGCGGEVVV